MIEFLKSNWGILVPVAIAVIGIIAKYNIHNKRKKEEKEKEEKKFKESITERVAKVEASLEMLTKLYPQLKSLEKLEDFEKLQLSPEDIKKTVSEVLKTTNITPEAIEIRIEEKLKKGLSKIDESTATITANILNEIDKRFKRPVANALDYLLLGNVEYSKTNYSKAVELYEKAIELKPDLAEAWFNKGLALVKLNQLDESLKAFGKSIELKPDFAKALHLTSLIGMKRHSKHLRKLRYEEALKALDKAIELNPDYAEAWYNRACIYSLKGQKEKALSDLKKAIELDISYKQKAKEDEDFKNLWDDPDFKKLVE